MPKPGTIKKASGEDYVLCEKCSEIRGKEIYWPKVELEERTGSQGGVPWATQSEPGTYCPRGHKIADGSSE